MAEEGSKQSYQIMHAMSILLAVISISFLTPVSWSLHAQFTPEPFVACVGIPTSDRRRRQGPVQSMPTMDRL